MKPWQWRAAVVLSAVFAFHRSVSATDSGTEMSDLWWVPAESGWGLQIVHQADTAFATLFAHGQDGQPVWYSATLAHPTFDTWTGDLYRTTGPWLGSPVFDPDVVTRTRVGAMTITGDRIADATLTYSVNGVTVVKAIQRQTLALEDVRGVYVGIGSRRGTGLPPCTADDNVNAEPTTWTVIGNVRAVTFVGKTANDTCTYTGPYQQTGRFGRVSGSYACTSGAGGQFMFYEMGRDYYAIRARTLVALPSGCIANGYIVGLEQPPPLQ